MAVEQTIALLINASLIYAGGLALSIALQRRVCAATRHAVLLYSGLCAALLPLLTWYRHSMDLPGLEALHFSPLQLHGLKDGAPIQPLDGYALEEVLLALWLAGVAWSLYHVARSIFLARRLILRAQQFHDPTWNDALAEAAKRLGTEPCPLYWCNEISAPALVGLLRPAILLPPCARAWSSTRRRHVLLHELAHRARRDSPSQLVSLVIRALYWFHPLSWWNHRLLILEQERSADDRVLLAGVQPSDYARDLLDLAVGPHPPSLAFSLSFVRYQPLTQRIESMLKQLHRQPPHCMSLAFGFAAALIVTSVLPSGQAEGAEQPRKAKVSGIHEGLIRDTVRKQEQHMRACYLPGLQRNPELAGRLLLAWEVLANGHVKNVVVKETTLQDKQVVECVRQIFEGFQFPNPPGGSAMVEYPLFFSPE